MAKFTEDDVLAEDTTSRTVSLQILVSKYSELGFDTKKVFINEAMVNIIPQQKDNEIRYTNDGTEPTKKSFLYTKPFTVSETTKLKIKEYPQDGSERPIFEANYIKQKPLQALNIDTDKRGLKFEYFELPKAINSVADLQAYKFTKKGTIEKFVFPYKEEELPNLFGLNYSGSINIPKEDVYTFSVLSNDGSRLYIDNQLVVNNDGLHGAYELTGEIALQKGWHKIKLTYFQADGAKDLKVFWTNSKFERKEISEKDLSDN